MSETITSYFSRLARAKRPVEQAFVDSGAVGRWLRTGNNFRSGGPQQVCRFFGNTATDPASGKSFGPNSHFYAADPAECDSLTSIYSPGEPGWQFESLDFRTTVPSDGKCASYTGVYRRCGLNRNPR